MYDFINHLDHGRGQLFTAVGFFDGDWDVSFDATELLKKVDVKIGSSELSIGDAFESDVFLEVDDFFDGAVFDFTQLLCIDLAFGFLSSGGEQVLWAQKTTHMVKSGWQDFV